MTLQAPQRRVTKSHELRKVGQGRGRGNEEPEGEPSSWGLLVTSWPHCLILSGIFIACCLSDNVQAQR